MTNCQIIKALIKETCYSKTYHFEIYLPTPLCNTSFVEISCISFFSLFFLNLVTAYLSGCKNLEVSVKRSTIYMKDFYVSIMSILLLSKYLFNDDSPHSFVYQPGLTIVNIGGIFDKDTYLKWGNFLRKKCSQKKCSRNLISEFNFFSAALSTKLISAKLVQVAQTRN